MQISGIQSQGMYPSQTGMMRRPQGDPEEMASQRAERIMSDRDSDGDNLISFEESGLDKDTFATIDADGDGLATSEEITASETERQQTIQSMLDAGDFEGVQALMGDMGPPPGMEGMTGMSMGDKGGGMIQMLANNAYSQGAQQGYNIDAMLLEQLDLAV